MINNIDKDEVVEYKSYHCENDRGVCRGCKFEKDCITKQMRRDPAIVHYKYKGLEWWADFDGYDNEIFFKCNNGYERKTSWEYDMNAKKFNKLTVVEKFDLNKIKP